MSEVVDTDDASYGDGDEIPARTTGVHPREPATAPVAGPGREPASLPGRRPSKDAA